MGEIKYMAGLYLRLSKDDERAGESVSIENQKLLLAKYAEEQGWEVRDYYIDDGWSGTNFQRPAFQRMMSDARDRLINLILVKDMSRLGRNHIEVGRLTDDVFPSLGIRFVAMNDRVDSLFGDDDMTAYRNLFNEFLSKDTSKKVRTVKRACIERGNYLGTYAPLGYKKDPLDKHHLVIDEETAHIVRRMFEMRCQGCGFRAIACTFNEERIPSPKEIYYSRNGRKNPIKENGVWNESTIKVILRNEVYIGHLVQGKCGTVSYKNHKLVSKPEEQWIRVENTHQPLIEQAVWETVRLLDGKGFKPRRDAEGAQSMFVGVLKCADCGFNMRANVSRGKRKDGSDYRYVGFICGNYARSGKSACTVHTIYESVLTQLILEEIRTHAQLAACDEEWVTEAIMQTKSRESIAYLATYQRELKSAEERLVQLDSVIGTLYEDRVRGVITDGMFKNLMPKYEREREDKTAAVKILRGKVERSERQWCDTGAWVKTIRKYTDLEVLSQDILLELIDRVEVYEAEKIGTQRVCRIRVVYRFVGDVSGSLAAHAGRGGALYAPAI